MNRPRSATPLASASLPQARDVTLSRRLAIISSIGGFITLALGAVVMMSQAPSLIVSVMFICAGLLLVLAPFYIKDSLTLFVVTHPSIFYVTVLLIFVAVRNGVSIAGFVDIELASFIEIVYQSAIICAYITFKIIFVRNKKRIVVDVRVKNEGASIALILWLFLMLYIGSQLIDGLAILRASGGIFLAIFYWLMLRYRRAGSSRGWFVVVISTMLICTVAVLHNQRTTIFLVLVIYAIYRLAHPNRLLTFKNLGLVIGGIFIINLLTYSFTDVRSYKADISPLEVVSRTLLIASSIEAIEASIPIFGVGDKVYSDSERQNVNYSAVLANNGTEQERDALTRFVLLPRMDIVTGRLGWSMDVDWNEIGVLIISSLPSVGQEKELNFSDKIVWALGLRPRESLGFPLVTVPGELYVLGGFWAVGVGGFICFLVVFVEIEVLRNLAGRGIEFTCMMFAVIFDITFTGTAIDLFSLILRDGPLLMGLVVASQLTTRPFARWPELADEAASRSNL